MIKEILKEAGRYDNVMNIINNIIYDVVNEQSYPVAAYASNGGVKWSVKGASVKSEAKKLRNLIESSDEIQEKESSLDDFSNLYHYVSDRTDMMLHNYAVSISHRNTPTIDMEKIRCWEILDNMIVNIGKCDRNDPEYGEWYIPDGWKKQ